MAVGNSSLWAQAVDWVIARLPFDVSVTVQNWLSSQEVFNLVAGVVATLAAALGWLVFAHIGRSRTRAAVRACKAEGPQTLTLLVAQVPGRWPLKPPEHQDLRNALIGNLAEAMESLTDPKLKVAVIGYSRSLKWPRQKEGQRARAELPERLVRRAQRELQRVGADFLVVWARTDAGHVSMAAVPVSGDAPRPLSVEVATRNADEWREHVVTAFAVHVKGLDADGVDFTAWEEGARDRLMQRLAPLIHDPAAADAPPLARFDAGLRAHIERIFARCGAVHRTWDFAMPEVRKALIALYQRQLDAGMAGEAAWEARFRVADMNWDVAALSMLAEELEGQDGAEAAEWRARALAEAVGWAVEGADTVQAVAVLTDWRARLARAGGEAGPGAGHLAFARARLEEKLARFVDGVELAEALREGAQAARAALERLDPAREPGMFAPGLNLLVYLSGGLSLSEAEPLTALRRLETELAQGEGRLTQVLRRCGMARHLLSGAHGRLALMSDGVLARAGDQEGRRRLWQRALEAANDVFSPGGVVGIYGAIDPRGPEGATPEERLARVPAGHLAQRQPVMFAGLAFARAQALRFLGLLEGSATRLSAARDGFRLAQAAWGAEADVLIARGEALATGLDLAAREMAAPGSPEACESGRAATAQRVGQELAQAVAEAGELLADPRFSPVNHPVALSHRAQAREMQGELFLRDGQAAAARAAFLAGAQDWQAAAEKEAALGKRDEAASDARQAQRLRNRAALEGGAALEG